MKHDCMNDARMIRLVSLLEPLTTKNDILNANGVAVCVVERLRHLAINNARRGDIGKIDNKTLADGIGWHGDADELINALLCSGWIIESEEYRFVLSGWEQDAPDFIKRNIGKAGGFVSASGVDAHNCIKETSETPFDAVNAPTIAHGETTIDAVKTTGIHQERFKVASNPDQTYNPTQHNKSYILHQNAFDDFWVVVHKRVGKQAAKRAFEKAVALVATDHNISKDDASRAITSAMLVFARSPASQPDDHTPIHPATWLNNGRYDDDQSEWFPKRKKPLRKQELSARAKAMRNGKAVSA